MEPRGVTVNEASLEWGAVRSPKGTFQSEGRCAGDVLTAKPRSARRVGPTCPFEVELVRVPPGKTSWPRHAHSVQWEYYIVRSGSGRMLQQDGEAPLPMNPGDHLIQPPGWVHSVHNDGETELVYYVIADHPVDESIFYPDSDKWAAGDHTFRMIEVDYWDGEV